MSKVYDDPEPTASESPIKKMIAKYLHSVIKSIQENPKLYQENDFGNFAIKLLNIFLKQTDERHVNIRLFKTPKTSGVLNTIEDMKEVKENIKIMIKELKFSECDENNFAFSISDASILNIHKITEIISQRIKNFVTEMCTKMIENFNNTMKDLVYSSSKIIDDMLNNIISTLQALKKSPNIEHFIKEFSNFLNQIEVYPEEKSLDQIDTYCKFTKFAYEITNGTEFKINFFEALEQMNDIENVLNKFLSWSKFLEELYLQISTYKIYNKCRNIGKIYETDESLPDFINLLKEETGTLNTISNIDLDMNKDLKVKSLNHLLNIVFEPMQEFFCTETGILTIKAECFCTSKLSALRDLYKDTKEIHIYAQNTVYFDVDIKATGQELKIFILAPTWEIIENRVIVLDGHPGMNPYATNAGLDEDGKAGKPGGPAGCFFGVVNNITNGHLDISANGGAGGPGQDGGDGSPGKDAETNGAPSERKPIHNKDISNKFLLWEKSKKVEKVYVAIWAGTEGKDGAKGGCGGLGGCKGTIQIHTGAPKPTTSNKDGANGKSGCGGKGGVGGKNKGIITTEEQTEKFFLGYIGVALEYINPLTLLSSKDKKKSQPASPDEGSARSGKDCTETTTNGLIKPKEGQQITNADVVLILQEYKEFISKSLDDKYRSKNLRKISLNCPKIID